MAVVFGTLFASGGVADLGSIGQAVEVIESPNRQTTSSFLVIAKSPRSAIESREVTQDNAGWGRTSIGRRGRSRPSRLGDSPDHVIRGSSAFAGRVVPGGML